MPAYRRVYGFGHLQADRREPGSAPLVSSMGLPYLVYIFSPKLHLALYSLLL